VPTRAEDLELVRNAVASVAHIASDREAAKHLGVSPKTLKDWRAGDIRPLRSPTRDKLINNRAAGGAQADGESEQPYELQREEGDLARVGVVPDPLLRIMERDSIAAVIRAQAVREAAWAARLEAQNAGRRDLPWEIRVGGEAERRRRAHLNQMQRELEDLKRRQDEQDRKTGS
jgi:hypothetical protein